MQSSHKIIVCILAVIVLTPMPFCYSESLQAAEMSVADVLDAMDAANEAVFSFEGVLQTYFKPGSEYVDVDLTSEGYLLSREFEWSWQRQGPRFRLKGKFGFPGKRDSGKKDWFYATMNCIYDGERLCTHNMTGGKIQNLKGFLVEWPNPLILMGEVISDGFQLRSVSQIMSESKVQKDAAASSGDLIALKCQFSAKGGEPQWLRVWIDSTAGFVPRRIAVEKVCPPLAPPERFDGRQLEIINESIDEVLPGVWLPTRGRIQGYLSEFVPPPGYTTEQINQLVKTDRQKAMEVERAGKMVANPTKASHYVFTLKPGSVNRAIPEKLFKMEFPPGMLVWDDLSKQSFRVPGVYVPDIGEPITRQPRFVPIVIANIVLLVIILSFVYWRHRCKS